jgi:pyruvate dehydrogenase (quinone)
MAQTVSEFVVERLQAWGVRRVFGYPGDGINGVILALAAVQDKLRFVQTRHEEMAAFMACGHAKFTGEPGVCIVTGGPGAIHVLNGLYDAKMDGQPVVAIVGQQARSALGSQYQQEVDLPALFKDVASEFVQTIATATQARHVVDRAFRVALASRRPTCIVIPTDVQEAAAKAPPHAHLTAHSSVGYSRPVVVPRGADLERAAAVLNAGERVAMLVGAGAANAADDVVAVADVLQAGIAKALLGLFTLPDDVPYVTGAIGLLGTKPTHDMMANCDTLLMVGSNFPYSEFLPKEGQARGVQVDIEGRNLGVRYPMEVNLQGDSSATLRALLPLLKRKPEGAWRRTIATNVKSWWETLDKRAHVEANPVNPQLVFHELSKVLPTDAMLATDTGSAVFWFARHIRVRSGQAGAHSGMLASMGAAMPYAIAAKFAHPARPAVAMVGDGAMQMNGMNALITVARYWREWRDPRFVVLVLNNRDLEFVSWEQRVMAGSPRFPASQDLPDIDYAAYARMLGFRGIRVGTPGEVAPALKEALASERPVVVDALVDPAVPMTPPHLTMEQVRQFLRALRKGDPDAAEIVRATVKEMLA